MPDNTTKIAEIRETLESGVSSSSIDGISTSIDRDSLRRELRRLLAEDDSRRGRRPAVASIDLSNLF